MELKTFLQESGHGSATRIAKIINAKPVDVGYWANKKRPVPTKRCVQIEQATGGLVTRRDLRPDDWAQIWPELKGDQ